MNTKSIKKENLKAYSDFFRRNSLIISQPLLLNWAGDVFSNYSGLRIKQKLPFRIYLGLTRIKEKEVRFKDISCFDALAHISHQTPFITFRLFFSQKSILKFDNLLKLIILTLKDRQKITFCLFFTKNLVS